METHLGTFKVAVTDWGGVGLVELVGREGTVVQEDYIMGNRFGELGIFLSKTGSQRVQEVEGSRVITRPLYEANAQRIFAACLAFSDPLYAAGPYGPFFRSTS
jgi:hypothetical protein